MLFFTNVFVGERVFSGVCMHTCICMCVCIHISIMEFHSVWTWSYNGFSVEINSKGNNKGHYGCVYVSNCKVNRKINRFETLVWDTYQCCGILRQWFIANGPLGFWSFNIRPLHFADLFWVDRTPMCIPRTCYAYSSFELRRKNVGNENIIKGERTLGINYEIQISYWSVWIKNVVLYYILWLIIFCCTKNLRHWNSWSFLYLAFNNFFNTMKILQSDTFG